MNVHLWYSICDIFEQVTSGNPGKDMGENRTQSEETIVCTLGDVTDIIDGQYMRCFQTPHLILPTKEKLLMVQPFFHRRISWMVLMTLLVLAFTLSACGGDTATTTSTTSTTSSSSASTGAASAVTITETTGGNDIYAFSPTTLSIKAGDSVKFTNNSDENHKLAVAPAGPTTG